MKIVFFGDSLTEGAYGGSYVNAIKQNHPDQEIINAGVGGNTILNLLERLEEDVLAHEPDGVFVMVGGNDAISYAQPKTRTYYRQVQNVPEGVVTPEMFSQTYRELLEQLHLNHVVTWMGLPPNEYSAEMVKMQQKYNVIAADAARTLNIPTLDLMPHFTPDDVPERSPIDIGFINTIGKRSSSDWDDYEAEQKRVGYGYTFDGLHLTPKSAEKMAEYIADFIGL